MNAETKELAEMPEGQAMVATNPMEMIAAALDKGMPPEVISQFMDLQERWEANKARRAFNEALVAVKKVGVRVRKTHVNKETRSKYADIDAICEAIDPHISANDLTITYTVEPLEHGFLNIIGDVVHVGGHSERHTFPLPVDSKGPKGGAVKTELHGACSTVTQGRKYLKLMIFDIPTYDDDGNAGAGKVPSVDETEVIKIREWIEALGRDEAKFCTWLKCSSLEMMTPEQLGRAKLELKKIEDRK